MPPKWSRAWVVESTWSSYLVPGNPVISPVSVRLATWQTDEYGLDWLRELAKTGKAIDYGGNGYPNTFTVPTEDVIPRILDKPPRAREFWHRDECDTVLDSWAGRTVIDRDAARQCHFDEWLLIIAWDES